MCIGRIIIRVPPKDLDNLFLTGSGGLKYKPLIDSDYISQEMTDRLEELSNPENSQGRRKANSRRGYAQLTSSGSRKKSSVKSSKVRTPHK